MKALYLSAFVLLAGYTRPAVLPPVVTVSAPPDSDVVRQYLARKERWAVKTGADPRASRVDLNLAVKATVHQLTFLSRPQGMRKKGGEAELRHRPVETTVYTVDAEIIRYKFETDDQDIHIVIRDPGTKGPTMIVEIADPSVVTRRSPFWKSIRDSRRVFFARYKPTTKFKKQRIRATITGVGFFDFVHSQNGVAPNGIELHPVLSVQFRD